MSIIRVVTLISMFLGALLVVSKADALKNENPSGVIHKTTTEAANEKSPQVTASVKKLTLRLGCQTDADCKLDQVCNIRNICVTPF